MANNFLAPFLTPPKLTEETQEPLESFIKFSKGEQKDLPITDETTSAEDEDSSFDTNYSKNVQAMKKPLMQNPLTQSSTALPFKYSLTDLENDPEFSKRAERFLKNVGRDENIFEYLRDADWSLTSAIVRAAEIGKWTDEEKDDYVYLRTRFNNADLNGFKERFNMVKDIGVDILADPINILSAIFLVPSGGTSIAARGALGEASKAAIKKLTLSQLTKRQWLKKQKAFQLGKKSALYGGAEGMGWGGSYSYFTQDIDVNLGLKDEIDATDVAKNALIDGIFTSALGGAIGGTMGMRYNQYLTKLDRNSNAELITQMGEANARKFLKKDSRLSRVVEGTKDKFNRGLAATFGKPTAWFANHVEKSPKLKEFLSNVRYDYATTLKGVKEKGVQPDSYGIWTGRLIGKLNYGVAKSLNVLYRTGLKAKLNGKQNAMLHRLLRDKKIDIDNIDSKWKDSILGEDFVGPASPKQTVLSMADFEKYAPDVILAYKGVRETLNEAFEAAAEQGLFGKAVQYTKGYFPRLFNYEVLNRKQEVFKQKLIDAGHADPLNEMPSDKFIENLGQKGTKESEIKQGFLLDAQGKDEEIFGRNFLQEAKVKPRTTKIKGENKPRKTYHIEDATPEQLLNMLEYKWTPFEVKHSAKESKGYLTQRRFTNLKDNDVAEFLENDVAVVLQSYVTNIGQTTGKTKFFGKSFSQFKNAFLIPIRNELKASGMGDAEITEVLNRVKYTKERITGEDNFVDHWSKETAFRRGASDFLKLTQQMAHLPLATLSSITEPLLLLSRASLKDSPRVAWDIVSSIGKETADIFTRVAKGTSRSFGIETKGISSNLGKPTKNMKSIFDTMDDDVWGELYKTGLALEQSVQERIEGLTGEALHGSIFKTAQQAFFKVNLLTQWTKAVQLASFTTGKRLIKENITQLSKGKTNLGYKLTKRKERYLKQQLNDLGVNPDEGVRWYKNSLNKDGSFNMNLSRGLNKNGESIAKIVNGQVDILNAQNKNLNKYHPDVKKNNAKIKRLLNTKGYQHAIFNDLSFNGGANRFTKEIILNPSTAEANRPLWFSHPAAQLLVQFAGYPTVFNNTILKRFSREAIADPIQSLPKAVPTVVLMTAVAHLGNTIRSDGENYKEYETGARKDQVDLVMEGVRRWGGYGPFDYSYKYADNKDRNLPSMVAAMKSASGPLPQDVIDMMLYRKSALEVGISNVPFYGAYNIFAKDRLDILPSFLPRDTEAMRKWARDFDKDTTVRKDRPTGTYYSKGGIVTNVPNVIDEPDERINPVTGIPYDETAGFIMQDEEERTGFNKGEIVDVDLVEKLLSGDEYQKEMFKEALIRISKGEENPISLQEFTEKLNVVADKVVEFESDNENIPKGGNKAGSSASGFYQFLGDRAEPKGATTTAMNRVNNIATRLNLKLQPELIKEFNIIRENFDVSLGSRAVQDLIFYANSLEMPGSDEYLKEIAYGNNLNEAAKKFTLDKHHTMTTDSNLQLSETQKRADKIFTPSWYNNPVGWFEEFSKEKEDRTPKQKGGKLHNTLQKRQQYGYGGAAGKGLQKLLSGLLKTNYKSGEKLPKLTETQALKGIKEINKRIARIKTRLDLAHYKGTSTTDKKIISKYNKEFGNLEDEWDMLDEQKIKLENYIKTGKTGRKSYVVGGLAKVLTKTIKGKQRSSKRLRRDYLNPNYLKTLKPKSANAASKSKFNKSAKDVHDLLIDGQITIKEAETYLKDYGYKNETVKKIVRSFKEVDYELGNDFITYKK